MKSKILQFLFSPTQSFTFVTGLLIIVAYRTELGPYNYALVCALLFIVTAYLEYRFAPKESK